MRVQRAGMRPLVALSVGAALAVAVGCGSRDGNRAARRDGQPNPSGSGVAAGASTAHTVQAAYLPDTSRMEPAVQQQLRTQFDRLTRLKDAPQTAQGDLAAAYGAMGNLLMAAEYWDAAETCYRNAESLAPADPRWPYYLGHLYKTTGDVANATASFEQTLRLRPDDEAALVWLGQMYVDQGRPADAEPLFTRALSHDARSVAALFGLGRATLAERKYAAAVQALEQALSIDPRASIVHYPLALAYRGLGDRARAEAHLRQRGSVEVGPPDPLMQQLSDLLESAVAYENRGVRALDQARWADAVAYLRKGIELAPMQASLHHELGTALAMTGDSRGAFTEFQTAVRLSPRVAKARYSLGLMLASMPGRQGEALAELAAAAAEDPSYIEARLQLANLLARSGRVQEALAHYDGVLATDPRVAQAAFGAAMAMVRLRRLADARDRLVAAVEAHPDELALQQALVRLLAAAPDDRVRDGRRAMALAVRLLQASGGNAGPDIAEAVAMAFAEAGQYDEAARWQREAITAATKAGRGDLAARMTDNLSLYERHQPCRTPWRENP